MKRVTPAQDARPNAVSKMEATKTYRKSLQGLHEEEYQQALVATKEKYILAIQDSHLIFKHCII